MSAVASTGLEWHPPEVNASDLRYSITTRFLEEFVKGHTIEDVLRELVQNEYDAGGSSLTVTFGDDGLQVDGNGQPIDRKGWRRLSVMAGTGHVAGDGRDVPRKENGIGSKNHGLRALFLIGDRIYVRSGDRQTVLDIHGGTYPEPIDDISSTGRPGAHIFVPFRASGNELLEAYDATRQQRDLGRLASDLAPTLLKLAQPGASRSLNTVTVTSASLDRTLIWRQKARLVRRHRLGGIVVERTIDSRESDGASPPRRQRMSELEYQRTVEIPAGLGDVPFPTYFRAPGGRVRIGASITLNRKRLDADAHGAFYAPLGFPDNSTGCAVGINAPFEMDSDRSSIIDTGSSRWNDWLVEVAADFVLDLLAGEWIETFGAGAYLALRPERPTPVADFADRVAEGLSERACWATRARASGSRRPLLQPASHLAPGSFPELDALLPDDWRLDTRVAQPEVAEMAVAAGARRFTLNSAIRYRCAGQDSTGLATKPGDGEAKLYRGADEAARADLGFQERFAKAVETHRQQLTPANRLDVQNTASTLTAAGTLAAPSDPLWVVDDVVWAVSPVALDQRLHPRLAQYGTLKRLCRMFDVSAWARDVAESATDGDVGEQEREALYRYLLRRPEAISRAAWPAIRAAPVFLNQRDEWVPATALVDRRAAGAGRLEAALSLPSRDVARNTQLLKRLRIRSKLAGSDLVRYAEIIAREPELADGFEETLYQFRRLLTRPTIQKLRPIEFLRSTHGRVAAPPELYVRTPHLLRCLGPDAEYAAGSHTALHAQLGCRQQPLPDDIADYLASLREDKERLADPEAVYPALLDALRDEGDRERFADDQILFVKGDWRAPSDVLVGHRHQRMFLNAVPLVVGGALESTYIGLGANAEPTDEHWVRLFEWFDERSQDGLRRLPSAERIALRGAYAKLPALPYGVSAAARVFLDVEGCLHSQAEARLRRYLIDDDRRTADAIRSVQRPIAFADVGDQAGRDFLLSSGVSLLTAAREEVRLSVGDERPSPLWIRTRDILDRLHQRSFASAVRAVTKATASKTAASENEIAAALRAVSTLTVVSHLEKTYRVGGYTIAVTSDVALDGYRVVLRTPHSKLELYRRLAQAVSAVAETTSTAQASLADFIYFLLVAESSEEQQSYLAERGVVWRPRSRRKGTVDAEEEQDDATREQIAETLTAGLLGDGKGAAPTPPNPPSKADEPRDTPPPRPPLPPIADVTLREADESDWRPTEREKGGGGGGPGVWNPRTPEQQEADRALGLRGEELVYREELKRVRALGFPESRVVWVSKANPAANHDILSVDAEGRDLWIEVKSSTGRSGYFEWPRAEFELALRVRKRYVLYRVYEADTAAATFRVQRDPVGAIRDGKMKLDVSGLAAEMAPASRANS